MRTTENVRKSMTYSNHKSLLKEFREMGISEKIAMRLVRWYHNRIDCMHGYKSETNAMYAEESLVQFEKDMRGD